MSASPTKAVSGPVADAAGSRAVVEAGGGALPFALAPDGVRVRVRLTPRARAARIDGLRADAAGHPRLAVSVTEVPEAGRANAALLALLAREWRLPKSAMQVVAGAADREKAIAIAGDGPALLARLGEWAAARGLGNRI